MKSLFSALLNLKKATIMKKLLILILLSTAPYIIHAQSIELPLWDGTPPLQVDMDLEEERVRDGILRVSNVQTPVLEAYLPDRNIATGKAVIIFPGGGYSILAYDWEGTKFAEWLQSHGIAGIVVKYRLPLSESLTDAKEVPLLMLSAPSGLRVIMLKSGGWIPCRLASWDFQPADILHLLLARNMIIRSPGKQI